MGLAGAGKEDISKSAKHDQNASFTEDASDEAFQQLLGMFGAGLSIAMVLS
jgi:hypothetical protein